MSSKKEIKFADFFAIQNLYSAYNFASDEGDELNYAACFTQDGILVSKEAGIYVCGHRELLAHKVADRQARNGRYRRHWNANRILTPLNNGKVQGKCYLLAYEAEQGEIPQIADCGVYEDILVKTNDSWKFEMRSIFMDATTWKEKNK